MAETTITIDSERCDFCGTCVAVCPADAIELKESTIRVDKEACTLCYHCVNICPLGVPEVHS
ncbi:4Fe-4S binding protein [bacterium]|nr:4Fe-4S binding protein [bacterium]